MSIWCKIIFWFSRFGSSNLNLLRVSEFSPVFPKKPIKTGLKWLNPLGWFFDENPGFLPNPGFLQWEMHFWSKNHWKLIVCLYATQVFVFFIFGQLSQFWQSNPDSSKVARGENLHSGGQPKASNMRKMVRYILIEEFIF